MLAVPDLKGSIIDIRLLDNYNFSFVSSVNIEMNVFHEKMYSIYIIYLYYTSAINK